MADTTVTHWTYLSVGFDPEDLALLKMCAGTEKLSRADVLRRALRAYARTMVPPEALAASSTQTESKVA